MGAKLIRVGGYSVGRLPNKYRDWVIELCLLVWVGSMVIDSLVFERIMGWDDDAPLMVEVIFEILNIVVVAVVWKRLQKMLPRSRWRTATYYLVSCVVVFAVAYVIIYFTKPGYFATSQEVVKALIVIAIFLLSAAVCAFLWRRRVVKGAEIIQRRAMKAKRRKITY